jgi:4-aminobutyrate aminotransferase / (S)-3-amino-2-methylpropionate transaminase / 5-aminovalerate transaminase
LSEIPGELLPQLVGPIPGPASRALARRLARVESRNITRITADAWPIFWREARGANVTDADGNRYIDLSAGFGVASAGHGNPVVARAIAEQAARLPHGMGDVYPADVKVALLERLAALAPGDLGISILAGSGAEAVEAALKTAALHTGRPGILAFEGAYHGLTYGALAATWRAEFRAPFRAQLFPGVRFLPYPRRGGGDGGTPAVLAAAEAAFRAAAGGAYPIGAVLVEPVQGRGGFVVPPPDFLAALRGVCDRHGAVLIFDEVYTGLGRTGRWFACEHEGVLPDVLVIGKSLGGGVPLSAAIGTPAVMAAWPPSTGEAIHTSTFLGNPVACAAALANLAELEERRLVERAGELGGVVRERVAGWCERWPAVVGVRGLGLMLGIELAADPATGRPGGEIARHVVAGALRRGVILLGEGEAGAILAITPPLVISRAQLDHALDVIALELADACAPR